MSLSPHNLHLLFCCSLSMFALIELVLVALYCASIKKDAIYSMDENFAADFGFQKFFSFVWDTQFFIPSPFVCFHYSETLVGFLSSKRSDSFLFWQYYFFASLSLPTSHYLHGTFSMPHSISMSWLYIPLFCYRTSNPFSFFPNSLMSSVYMKRLIF